MLQRALGLSLVLVVLVALSSVPAAAAGEACGAGAGNACGTDEFCKPPVGDCGTTGVQGVCTPRPQACPDVWDPVCGCDGQTYGNECEADQAGAPIRAHGPCEQACGGPNGETCPNDEFCLLPDGACDDPDAAGHCVARPLGCPDVWDPVCGCDGQTYGNRCEAVAAGAQVRRPGECPQVCGGIAGVPCDDGQYCKLPAGQCEVSDLQGVCVPLPTNCPAIYDPVCGCDGQTYNNACEADQAGAQVDRPGECERVCGGIAGVPCDDGEYCAFPDGTCDIADNQGVCRPVPQACPDVWAPVCGCDGQTYGNRCEAAAAGAQVNQEGECPPPVCGGIAGIQCGEGEFCKLPDGECDIADNQGICQPIPDTCPEVFDPVCGCDGQTYSNSCFADQAGAQISHPGECPPVQCGFIDGPGCGEGEFCKLPAGQCEVPDQIGICQPTPDVCPEIYDPVCGCDGLTYGNECEADRAGAQIDHDGECEQVCGGFAGAQCDEGEYCAFPDGTCDIADNQGVCRPIPQACPDVWDPVCGCDGQTYGNRCDAAAAGAQVNHEGECEQVCGGIAGVVCDDGEVCVFADNTCGVADNQGVCRPIPQACPDVWDPVCGCDGHTYGNRCEALAAGAQVNHEGECQPRVCGNFAGVPCDEGEFCKLPPGECDAPDAQGTCQPIPDACPEVYDPVCGCNGVTYANECFADLEGVQVDHPGECPRVCGGIAGIPCEDGEFCKLPAGECHIADNQGVCHPIPVACPLFFDPVCGCDGVTYDNECDADRAGAQIDHEGACEQVCGGIAGIPCDDGEYCVFQDGTCDISDNQGVCRPVPQACPDVWDPVCGCDGQTYGNRCEAAAAEVQVASEGECEQVCGGIAGIPCDDGEFCLFPPGTCDFADHFGTCVPIPDECPAVCHPVCGCDGQTYGNRCLAFQAEVSLDHRGECDPEGRLIQKVRFESRERMRWQPAPGALSYNVYIAVHETPPPVDAGECFEHGIQQAGTLIEPIPHEGAVFLIQVTGVFQDGEGPMGISSNCSSRAPATPCDAN